MCEFIRTKWESEAEKLIMHCWSLKESLLALNGVWISDRPTLDFERAVFICDFKSHFRMGIIVLMAHWKTLKPCWFNRARFLSCRRRFSGRDWVPESFNCVPRRGIWYLLLIPLWRRWELGLSWLRLATFWATFGVWSNFLWFFFSYFCLSEQFWAKYRFCANIKRKKVNAFIKKQNN